MTTVEAPVPTVLREDTTDVDDLVAHLFERGNRDISVCGVTNENDIHSQLHVPVKGWRPGVRECPICGTKVCPDCERIALDRAWGGMWKRLK